MKAVNLIPEEVRGRRPGSVGGDPFGAYTAIGALAVALVLVVAYVVFSNQATHRKESLAQQQAHVTELERQSAALKPFADLAALRTAGLSTVTELAGTRFRWPRLLDQISRLIPPDVTVATFDGSTSGAAGATPPAPAAAGTAVGPSLALSGCTTSHSAVARMIERMRAVDGVQDVVLSSSSKAATPTAAAAGACARSTQFQMTLTLAAPAGGAPGATPTTPPGAPATTTPAPATTTPTATTPVPTPAAAAAPTTTPSATR